MERLIDARHKLILVLEDDPAISELLELALTDSGSRVVTAASLREARKRCKERMPDLIIADLLLPDGLGTDLVQDLSYVDEDRRPPSIILSALSQAKNHARSVGADRCYMKPFDLDELHAAALELLARPAREDDSTTTERSLSSVAAG
jgi:DNA-binding response OmpR family regulator